MNLSYTMLHKKIPSDLITEIKSITEENANIISHAAGLILFLLSTPFLINLASKTADTLVLWGTIIYCITLLMVYSSSTLYHQSSIVSTRKKLRIFDHICIYFLIAGTYTPLILKHLQGTVGWTTLIALWSTVLIGSIFKLFFTHKFKLISTLAYLGMGWAALFIIKPLYESAPTISLISIGIGALSYTIGTFFYLRKNMYLSHLIWHLFVLGGSISHFIAIWMCF